MAVCALKILLIFASLSGSITLAGETGKSTVEVAPGHYDPKAFAGTADNVSASLKAPKDELDPEARDRIFARVGNLDLSGFDELDKDLLLIRARSLKAAELEKKYPRLPKAVLKRLQLEASK